MVCRSSPCDVEGPALALRTVARSNREACDGSGVLQPPSNSESSDLNERGGNIDSDSWSFQGSAVIMRIGNSSGKGDRYKKTNHCGQKCQLIF